jgi:hypothetical protein
VTRWEWLVTQERRVFRSATMYVAMAIGVLPDIAGFLQANWHEASQYIPAAYHSQSLKLIGAIVFLARLRSLVRVPKP